MRETERDRRERERERSERERGRFREKESERDRESQRANSLFTQFCGIAMQTNSATRCVVSNVSRLTSLTLGPSKVCQASVTSLPSKPMLTATEGGGGSKGDQTLPIPTALSRAD